MNNLKKLLRKEFELLISTFSFEENNCLSFNLEYDFDGLTILDFDMEKVNKNDYFNHVNKLKVDDKLNYTLLVKVYTFAFIYTDYRSLDELLSYLVDECANEINRSLHEKLDYLKEKISEL